MQKHIRCPLVSVILPTYNRGWILKEAIDSVMGQDFKDFELIVVDDGSTDDTGCILEGYGRRLRSHFQPRRGVSAARNTGIQKAAGRYIAFLDSDDLWLPGKLTAQIDFFSANPKAVACQTDEIWVRRGVRVNCKRYHLKSSEALFERSLKRCMVSPSAVMVRRFLFDEVKLFDESLPACEDYDFWLRVTCRYPVALIPAPLVIKRGGHADQLSRGPGLDRFRIDALVKRLDAGVLSNTQRKAAAAVLREKCGVYAGGCLKRGRRAEYRRYMNLAQRFPANMAMPLSVGPISSASSITTTGRWNAVSDRVPSRV